MPPRPQSYAYVVHAAIESAEKVTAHMRVVGHPHGGYTIAIGSKDGGASIYDGNYPSEGVALQELAGKRARAIQEALAAHRMKGMEAMRAKLNPEKNPEQTQMNFA